MKRDIFDQMGERWPSAIVSRSEVGKFSGGMLSSKYVANLDSQGVGPVRVKIGRRVGYPVQDLVQWMRERKQ